MNWELGLTNANYCLWNGLAMRSCGVTLRTMSRHLRRSTTMGEKLWIHFCVTGSPCCTVEKKKKCVGGNNNKKYRKKKKKILTYVITWMSLEDVRLIEISSHKNTNTF